MEVTCTIEGMGHLKAQFEELSNKAQRAVMRKALTQTGAVVLKAARAKCPVKTGKLKKSIKQSVSVKEGGESYVKIFVSKPHGHLIEFGHAIKRVKGGPTFGHVPAHPFMRPAIDESHPAIIARFAEAMKEQVQKQTAKARAL